LKFTLLGFLQKSHKREKTITLHRMDLLQQIGVADYKTKKTVLNHSLNDKKWSIMFQELLKYKDQYGDCLVLLNIRMIQRNQL
jgi:hypothetical protein